MLVTELETFVQKFHQLWKAGLSAHLDLESHAGNAWVGLRLRLGQDVPGPHLQVFHPSSKKSDSPSRQRRRARREAVRKSSAAEASNKENEKDPVPSDKNTEEVVNMDGKDHESVEEADECSKDTPEKADEDIVEIPVVEINHEPEKVSDVVENGTSDTQALVPEFTTVFAVATFENCPDGQLKSRLC